MPCILSIDIGTSSIKGALISAEGEVFHASTSFYSEWGFFYNYEKFPISLWERSFFKVLEILITANRSSLLAISISANAPSLIPLSKEGKVLSPLLHHLADLPRKPLKTVSFYISPLSAFKEVHPSFYEEVDCFLTISEYFVYLLTGEKVTASPSVDYDQFFWTQEDMEKFGLSFEKMAPFARSGDVIGSSRGLRGEPAGIPVVLAGIDYLSALLGSGATEAGVITDRAGSSEGLNLCAPSGTSHPDFHCLSQLPAGLTNVGALMGQTGIGLDRMRHLGRNILSFGDVFRHIDAVGENQNLFYLSPKELFWQYSLAKGVYKGATDTSDVWSLARARLEAVGFSLRAICEIWEEAGLKMNSSIRLTGGQSKFPAWNQLKANLIGKPLGVLKVSDAELLGNAILAGKAMGLARSLRESSQRMVKVVKVIEPEPYKITTFREKYEQFKFLSLNCLL